MNRNYKHCDVYRHVWMTYLTLSISAVCLIVLSIPSCVTPQPEDSSKMKITDTSEVKKEIVPAELKDGFTDYSFAGGAYKAEWMTCQIKQSKGVVVVMHRDQYGFDRKEFCTGWIAQTFIAGGYDVITVNRPGYAGSTGSADFAGPQSIAAIEAGVADVQKKNPAMKNIVGVWGYSTGAIAASFFAKKHRDISWLILGAGLYDLEDLDKSTQSSVLKKEIGNVTKYYGAKGIEDRSIAFDMEGLPKKIQIYHGKLDNVVPQQHVQNFRNALASGEFDVTLQVIDGVSHEIPLANHRQILEVILVSLSLK